MREIKFRVWHKEKEKMFYNAEKTYDDYETASSFGALLDCKDKFIVMQYTGRKDKTDKEIYEGDIIHFKREFGSGFFIGVVEYRTENACFGVKCQDSILKDEPSFAFGLSEDWLDLVVIGNICENKGLLENKNVRKI